VRRTRWAEEDRYTHRGGGAGPPRVGGGGGERWGPVACHSLEGDAKRRGARWGGKRARESGGQTHTQQYNEGG